MTHSFYSYPVHIFYLLLHHSTTWFKNISTCWYNSEIATHDVWDYAVTVYWLKLLDTEFEHMANMKVEGCQTGLYLSTEEIYFLEYNAMLFSDSQLTFQRNISPPYWVLKRKPSKKPHEATIKQSKSHIEKHRIV
jgi:hypothetical protein